MASIYHQFINEDTNKYPLMPKMYIFDFESKQYLSLIEFFELFSIVDEEKKQNYKTFYGRELPQSRIRKKRLTQYFETLTHAQRQHIRFLCLYFNFPPGAESAILSLQPAFVEEQQHLLELAKNNPELLLSTSF